jgi:hypothetical protein
MKISIIVQLREAGWDGVEWIYLIKDKDKRRADVNPVGNLRVP